MKFKKILLPFLTLSPIILSISCTLKDHGMTSERKSAVKNFLSFSKKHKNILYLFSDEITGSNLKYILDKKFPSIKKDLTNFTFYEKTITAGKLTNANVPSMVGGWNYTVRGKNDPASNLYKKTFYQFIDSAYAQTVNMLSQKGYEGDLIGPQWFGKKDASSWWGDSNYWNKIFKNNKTRFQSAYPFDFLNQSGVSNPGNTTNTTAIALNYLDKFIKVKKPSDDKTNMYKGYFNESTHLNWHYVKNNVVYSNDLQKTQDFFVKKIRDIIIKLKKLKVYDNTMIIIASDHGTHNGGTKWIKKEVKSIGINLHDNYAMNSLFMIKPFKKESKIDSPLKYNFKNIISTADIPQIIAHELNSDYFTKKASSNNIYFNQDPLSADPGKRVFSHEKAGWFQEEEGFLYNNQGKNIVYEISGAQDIYDESLWKVNTYGNTEYIFKNVNNKTYRSFVQLKNKWYGLYSKVSFGEKMQIKDLWKVFLKNENESKFNPIWVKEFNEHKKTFFKWIINNLKSQNFEERDKFFNFIYKK